MRAAHDTGDGGGGLGGLGGRGGGGGLGALGGRAPSSDVRGDPSRGVPRGGAERRDVRLGVRGAHRPQPVHDEHILQQQRELQDVVRELNATPDPEAVILSGAKTLPSHANALP